MKKTAYWLLIIASVLLLACTKKGGYTIPKHYKENNPSEDVSQSIQETKSESVSSSDDFSFSNDDWEETYDEYPSSEEYLPARIYVGQGMSFSEALNNDAPQMDGGLYNPYVGGVKLIAEMSADAAGVNISRPRSTGYIKILPLGMLKLTTCDDDNDLYRLVKQGIVSINDINIDSNIWGGFLLSISLTNNTGQDVVAKVRQGQMIESQKEDVQNIVVKTGKKVTIRPFGSLTIRTDAMCAARKRSDPTGSKGRITPYMLNAPQEAYQSKYNVWDYIEEPARHRMVFYAWGQGTELPGHRSKTGHAFVSIPTIGVRGFGSTDSFYGSAGKILKEGKDRQYATDSCIVFITETQLQKVKAVFRELEQTPPDYNLGIYDCTSFVMDIADAAGVYYGKRWLIQWPTDFIRQLNKYNVLQL